MGREEGGGQPPEARVSFEEAHELLEADADCLEIFDEDHSDHEERFITIGAASAGVLVVVWTEREHDVVRVIATANEQRLFYQSLRGGT